MTKTSPITFLATYPRAVAWVAFCALIGTACIVAA